MSSPSTPTPPGVPSDNTTLVAVLAACAAEGFDGDFYVTDDATLRCGACRAEHAATETVLCGLRRLEGASDPADMAAVLSLECPSCGAKGTAVVRFGPEAGPADDQVLAAVEDHRG